MNWLGRMIMAAGGIDRDPGDDFWYGDLPIGTPGGEVVTEAIARRVPAVYDCQRVLADPVKTLPLHIYRQAGDNKVRVDDHPVADILRRRPNDDMTASEFRGFMQWNLGFYRNAYAEIRPGPRGAIDQLIPFHPTIVQPERRGGVRWYLVNDGYRQRALRFDEMWHLRMDPLRHDGLAGIPLLTDAAESIGKALAVHRYGARFFANGGKSGGVITHPTKFQTKDDRERFMAAWKRANTGAGAHSDKLLEHGMGYDAHGVANNEAQFLETLKECAIELSRYWGVPPHKIGILDRATFSNIEQQALEFVIDTLMPWLVTWEQAIVNDLILQPGLFAEFNVGGLLRGDIKTRFEAYAKARQWGWLSVNEIRALENRNGIGPAGDVYLEPLNMIEVGEDRPEQGSGAGRVARLERDLAGVIADLRAAQAAEPEGFRLPLRGAGGLALQHLPVAGSAE